MRVALPQKDTRAWHTGSLEAGFAHVVWICRICSLCVCFIDKSWWAFANCEGSTANASLGNMVCFWVVACIHDMLRFLLWLSMLDGGSCSGVLWCVFRHDLVRFGSLFNFVNAWALRW